METERIQSVWKEKLKNSKTRKTENGDTEIRKTEYGKRISVLRSLFSVSLFSVLCFLASCQFKVPKDTSAVVQNLPTDPESLNPITASSAYSSLVAGYIYEQLFELDNETLLPKPVLAKRWEVATNRMQYTFYLREDVKWQDGAPLTADDVLYTYETIQNPKVDAAPLRNYYKDVLKAEKLGPFTVRFTYRNPYAGAFFTLGMMTIIPKHIFGDGHDFNAHPANRKPLGSGPYIFEEWKTGQRIVLKRHKQYWRDSYHFKKLVFKIIPSGETAFQLFKKGDIDLIDLSPLQWARQTQSEKFSKQFVKHQFFTPFSVYNYIGWNMQKPLFKDKRVRQALAHLVERTAINDKLLFGLYMPITGPYYPLGSNYDKALPLIVYDLEEAEKLLDEAGWIDHDGDGIRDKEGAPLRFTMLFSTGVQFYEQLTPILQQNFSRAGIDLDLRRLEAVTLFRLLEEHDFDAYLAAWGRGVGIEDMYQIFHSSQSKGGSNFVSYANPNVDRLLEEGRREFDPKKRSLLYKEVHRLLYEDQPYLFMFARPELLARDKRFKNVKEYPIGLDMREWMVE